MPNLLRRLLSVGRPRRDLLWGPPQAGGALDHQVSRGFDFESMTDVVDGLAYPDWRSIHAWIADRVERDDGVLEELWTDIAIEWFRRLAEGLGEGYACRQSPNFLLVHALDDRRADLLLTHAERATAYARDFLSDCAFSDGYGPVGIVHLSDRDTYIRYRDFYALPGEQAESGACFVQSGYGHMVLFGSDLLWLERASTHELAHSLLQQWPHPAWLAEALAMSIENAVCGDSVHLQGSETIREFRQGWDEERIQDFWSGAAFAANEGVFEHSYLLAEALFRPILAATEREPERRSAFVRRAEWTDAGAAAARDVLGLELGELVSGVLGPGRWGPDVDAIARYARQLEQGGECSG